MTVMTFPPEVLPTSEARIALPATLERFRSEGMAAQPLFFGSHRRVEAVVIPASLYEAVADAVDDAILNAQVRTRIVTSGGRAETWDEVLAAVGIDERDVLATDISHVAAYAENGSNPATDR